MNLTMNKTNRMFPRPMASARTEITAHGRKFRGVLPPGAKSLEEWGRTVIEHGREFKNLSYRTVATSDDSRHTRCPHVRDMWVA